MVGEGEGEGEGGLSTCSTRFSLKANATNGGGSISAGCISRLLFFFWGGGRLGCLGELCIGRRPTERRRRPLRHVVARVHLEKQKRISNHELTLVGNLVSALKKKYQIMSSLGT